MYNNHIYTVKLKKIKEMQIKLLLLKTKENY